MPRGSPMKKAAAKRRGSNASAEAGSDIQSLSPKSAGDEQLDKAEKDKEKAKFKLTKEKIQKYAFAQPTFKNRLENQMNQFVKHGEQLQTSNLHHKQLYGYIQCQDALHLETVK